MVCGWAVLTQVRALRFNSLALDPSGTHLPGRLLAHPISPRGTTPPSHGGLPVLTPLGALLRVFAFVVFGTL